ncbi:msr9576 (plasmid) [Mesorhizobium japonicum MAFF 303099]|uniref:Msr9576 protein n=2 Tax=Mesorhizobium japonicum TaxID=2066070 RepID=Q98P81_RHILO|nr:msr9576 [Mesorhizobium japonicum MAFF 303099]
MLQDRLPSHGPPAHLSEKLHNLSFSQLWGPVLKLIFGLLLYGITRWSMTAFREQEAQTAG